VTTPGLTEALHCLRCYAAAPDPASDEFLAWDPVGEEDAVVCPHCLIDEEELLL